MIGPQLLTLALDGVNCQLQASVAFSLLQVGKEAGEFPELGLT
jgi:hypothetical protein